MGVFNYTTYAKNLEIGISKLNMTKIAKALFEPIIIQDGVVNQAGNPYTIDSKQAKFWFEQTKDIPGNIKTAAGNSDLVNGIGDYFSEHIVDELINQNKESAMYSAMVTLVRKSDLEKDEKELLLQFYSDGDRAEFLGRAFLFAVVRDNTIKDPIVNELPAAEDIRIFKELVKKNHRKPTAIIPPTDIEDHELGYMSAWANQSGTLNIEFLNKLRTIVPRNKEKIAGITDCYSIRVVMPICAQSDTDRFFSVLSDYCVEIDGNIITDTMEMNRHFYDFDNWRITRKDGTLVSKKTLRREIEKIKIKDIETNWSIKYENKWDSVVNDIEKNILNTTAKSVPMFHKDYLMKFFVALNWRGFQSNQQFEETFKALTKGLLFVFNSMKTNSEISEFIGLKELMEAIFHLVRNPVAHTSKINWKVDEDKALDILTLISSAHKYLDECHKMPGKI